MSEVTKEQLQKLLDNVDMEKLNIDDGFGCYSKRIAGCLEQCQKEPTLHDKLLARGFVQDTSDSKCYKKNISGDYICVLLRIRYVYLKYSISSERLNYKTEQQLFDAIDLFEKWSKDESSVLNGNDMPF